MNELEHNIVAFVVAACAFHHYIPNVINMKDYYVPERLASYFWVV
jgi:hypothetical protein